MRRHGLHRPFNALQVGSWTILLVIGTSYYLLVVPLFASPISLIIGAAYALLVTLSIGFGIATSWIDPGDEGVLLKREGEEDISSQPSSPSSSSAAAVSPVSGGPAIEQMGDTTEEDTKEEEITREESAADTAKRKKKAEAAAFKKKQKEEKKRKKRRASTNHKTLTVNPFGGETRLERVYCYICQANVCQTSAHCRFCDKCIDSFDHHCKWLNNCVGRRNYYCFIATVAMALLLTTLQSTVTALAITWYCMHGRFFAEKVESYLPDMPPELHVALLACTGVILLPVVILLGQLLIFHIMLKYEGITTYEYVVRETRRQKAREEKAAATRELEAMARQNMVELGGRPSWGGGGTSAAISSSSTVNSVVLNSRDGSASRHNHHHRQYAGAADAGASPMMESMICSSPGQVVRSSSPSSSSLSSSHSQGGSRRVLPLDPQIVMPSLPAIRTEDPIFAAPP